MKPDPRDFHVDPGDKIELRKWPTIAKPFCETKIQYRKLLKEHIERLAYRLLDPANVSSVMRKPTAPPAALGTVSVV